ncbi:aminotransferase class III-fold pyridoxal phosphate-dependent enzyme [Marinicella rhabdoformis]|uniref:aminotransferase class III-fold pyridoxal phosphate-dependent enzyme n=1 Tax=Marinicella rhabdoformis TaxID=2580566 RepID=UPI0012AEC98B|nr:aminotransferase class III-fold pyridoxal phosphate-dependent enzyme [Marinicella rhabdoformis]
MENIKKLLWQHYQLKGELIALVGDCDLNFLLDTGNKKYTVKLSAENAEGLNFEQSMLGHMAEQKPPMQTPQLIKNTSQQAITSLDTPGHKTLRVLTWLSGDLWASYSPKSSSMRYQLGEKAAQLDLALKDFKYTSADKVFDWDLAQALWVETELALLTEDEQQLVMPFVDRFKVHLGAYQELRSQVIHNDINDHNIVVNQQSGEVTGFIDFGDAVKSQLINEVAIASAYAASDCAQPLEAVTEVVTGFHSVLPLTETELAHLYHLIAMRAVVSVVKSKQARTVQPDNAYKNVSEAGFWLFLKRWSNVHPDWAEATFRHACGFDANVNYSVLVKTLNDSRFNLNDMMPSQINKSRCHHPDMSVGSVFLGNSADYSNFDLIDFKINQLQKCHPDAHIAGGYGECRPFYTSDAFKLQGNQGYEYRTCHLGLDVWSSAHAPVHAPLDGEVISAHINPGDKDYGPTLIVKHEINGLAFYTLYGHLSHESLGISPVGKKVKRGDLLCTLGLPHENGGWSPHLHFQIISNLLGNTHDFAGACRPKDWPIMKQICLDPMHLLTPETKAPEAQGNENLFAYRQKHLGYSLSLAHGYPIQMLRGDGVYMLDQWGQKYLDTCNNVAHVGHEHPAVVQAGQEQMALLNTNSRYLHPEIVAFTQALLKTLPDELSVVHCVNSGSEANELAMRMAKAYSGGKDVIALESGYHGNANACIDISSYKFDGTGGAGAPEQTHILPLPDTFRGLYQGENAAQKYAQHADDVLDALSKDNKQVAAFISEIIVSCGGQIEPPVGYFKQVYQSVRVAGGLCIADEVQTGCGRVGSHFWAFQRHDVVPDIVTIGKPIGNGHPLAVVVCTSEVAKRFANGMEYFNTFGGNPVSARIGRAVLEIIDKEQLQQQAAEVGQYLIDGLNILKQKHPIIADVRGVGLFLGFELCNDDKKPLPEHASYLANRMREQGILISTDGPDHNVIKIKPPITFDRQHADELLGRLAAVMNETLMSL